MPLLARIETDFLTVELSGRSDVPRALALQGPFEGNARFEAVTTRGAATITNEGSAEFEPPTIFEERDYELIARSKVDGLQPVLSFRDPTVLTRTSTLPEAGLLVASARFRGQVGLSSWSVHLARDSLTVTMEVFPSKLNYSEDYASLIYDVTSVKRALVLEYLRATHTKGGVDDSRRGGGIEWLSMLRQEIERLEDAVRYVNALPRRTLVRDSQSTWTHLVRGSTNALREVTRGLGSGPFESVPGVGSVRARINASRTYESLDTVEHRWLRSRLKHVHERLRAFSTEQRARIKQAESRYGRAAPRLQAELDEIVDFTSTIEQLLRLPVLAAATIDVPATLTTLQLQSAVGYEQAHRVLTRLGSALGSDGETQQYSTSDLHELYEVWCFLKVAQTVAEVLGAELDLTEMIPREASGLRFSLRKGQGRSVKFIGHRVLAGLAYNPIFDVPTGVQKPDIVLRVATIDGSIDSLIVFDAKYRVDASPEYVARYGSPGAPVDAVNELHRYRDAIEVAGPEGATSRPVIAGVALFPWADPLPATQYRMRAAAETVGVGALPLLPQNDHDLRSWLAGTLDSLGLPTVEPPAPETP